MADVLLWVGIIVATFAGALLLMRWLFAKDDPRNWEMTHEQPWSDPSRFGEED